MSFHGYTNLSWNNKARTLWFQDISDIMLINYHYYSLIAAANLFCSKFQITQQQIKQFAVDMSTFQEKFATEGPGSVGGQLDKGNPFIIFTNAVSNMDCII